ncbi:hypothetical protein KY290_025264 [Solanum tuberosum]|uniref:Uncharacterized protein n=1 Tax=Solanum tuberosum TaxID=4113 RepID=A0ABQ7UT29_SOLTU|nr:hypothetical protein KY284_024070 [Solanum tuberosum]KAH0754994.1 hypothetical protein KY290_025264 [Solanum tuberosum]
MALMVLDRFSGGNPTGWIVRAEQYFTYLGFSAKEWLPITHFYLDGAAYDWFQWLYRNNQFFDWKHFIDKLALHFANDFNEINDTLNALDLMQKLDDNFSYILLAFDTDTVDKCIQPSLQVCVVQTHTQVLLSDLLFDLNDGPLEEVTGGTLEEVFDERFHTISTVRCYSNNLVKFDEMLFALLCMLLDCSSSDGIFAYLSELDPTKLSLSLYRFPPAQFKLEFPFDPGSEIIKIFVSHFDSTISDQYTLDQFPYDPGANVFILTSGGSLQVHQLHLATFVFNLLLVMDTFQLFESVSYIRPTVKLAKPLIVNESIISIRNLGISSKFWAITGSRDRVEVLRVFEAVKNNWSCLFAKLSNWEQLGGVEMGVETFNAMYFNRCLWVTEHIGDHLDYSCMEYKCGILVKEFHTCDDKVEISEFIVSAKFVPDFKVPIEGCTKAKQMDVFEFSLCCVQYSHESSIQPFAKRWF